MGSLHGGLERVPEHVVPNVSIGTEFRGRAIATLILDVSVILNVSLVTG